LNPHAARNLPAPFPYAAADFFKHTGRVFLHPLVISRAGAGKYKTRVFLYPVKGGAECRLNFGVPFLPPPKPNRVNMRVAD
jgi:hypothetical protein